jgi:hypothetical protein
MPGWLVEGDPAVYALLAGVLAALLAVWWRTRKRQYAIAAGVIAVLIVGYALLDFAVESDGEQMVRKVREVAAAVSANSVNAAMENVSNRFNRHGLDKEQFGKLCERYISRGEVTAVQVWDLTAVDVSRQTQAGTVEFHFKVHGRWGETPPNWFGRVVFTLDPDGQWRVKDFDVYDSLNQSKTPIAIPGWGG